MKVNLHLRKTDLSRRGGLTTMGGEKGQRSKKKLTKSSMWGVEVEKKGTSGRGGIIQHVQKK